MLKWTARAFALAAAMHMGMVSAQDADVDAGVELIPPGPEEVEAGAEVELELPADANRDVERDVEADIERDATPPRDAADDAPVEEAPIDDAPAVRERRLDRELDQPRSDRELDRDVARPPVADDLPDVTEERSGAVQRESRYLPDDNAAPQEFELSDQIRSATANLDIDDATRSRYRWHNGEWWFKTKSGLWKFHRDGDWHEFDPTTYRAPQPGILYSDGSDPQSSYDPQSGYAPQSGYVPQSSYSGGYGVPQTYSSGGYYYSERPYTTMRRSGVYRPDYERFDGRYYGGGYGGRVYGDGFYGDNYYGDNYYGRGYGYGGYQGYNPGNDRYYGRGPYGGYSIDGDRYRGAVIGSEIGGQLGGRTGAILGGAIGAEAAD